MDVRKVLGTVVFIIAAVGGKVAVRALTAEDPTSEKFLSKISKDMNGTLPMMVDSETELAATSAAPGVFTYEYRLVNMTSAEIDAAALKAAIEPEIRRQACSDKDTRKVLDAGVTLRYSYDDKSHVHVADVDVRQADCS